MLALHFCSITLSLNLFFKKVLLSNELLQKMLTFYKIIKNKQLDLDKSDYNPVF